MNKLISRDFIHEITSEDIDILHGPLSKKIGYMNVIEMISRVDIDIGKRVYRCTYENGEIVYQVESNQQRAERLIKPVSQDTEYLYIVCATRVLQQRDPKSKPKEQRWNMGSQVPTFYVIASSEEMAQKKAAEILGADIDHQYDIESVHPSVCRVDEP